MAESFRCVFTCAERFICPVSLSRPAYNFVVFVEFSGVFNNNIIQKCHPTALSQLILLRSWFLLHAPNFAWSCPVSSCASSPVYKTRMMAARALAPLVATDQTDAILERLLLQLPACQNEARHNHVHGLLLQVN